MNRAARVFRSVAGVSCALACLGPTTAAASPAAPTEVAAPPQSWAGPGAAEPDPNHSTLLAGVDGLSADDAWAVGYRGRGTFLALARHWDGQRWRAITTPTPGQSSYLLDVAMVTSDDVWAVGTSYPDPWHKDNVVMHWDGHSWSLVDVPQPGGEFDSIDTVSVITADDVFASGRSCIDKTCVNQTMHWDGQAWTWVQHEPLSLVQIADASSLTDAWSVGTARYRDGVPVVQRWNGQGWRETKFPSPPYRVVPSEIASPSSEVAWMTGTYLNADGSARGGVYLERWDGSKWKDARVARHALNYVSSVSSDADDDAWLIGYELMPPRGIYLPVTEHWDGRRWTYVDSPAHQLGQAARLYGLAAISGDDAWAVGSVSAADGDHRLVMHWDGSRWYRSK
jgi:hypothetical protein